MNIEQLFWGNTAAQWLRSGLITLCVFFLLFGAKMLIQRLLLSLAHKTENKIDDLLADLLTRLKAPIVLAFALFVGSRFLAQSDKVRHVLNNLAVLILLLQIALWGNGVIEHYLAYKREKRLDQNGTAPTFAAFGFLLKALLWTIILLLALDNLGIDITALITGLGIGGVAIALALQHILSDLFASLSIALDKPFVIGDFITIDTFMGHVEHIGLKTTRIRSISGEQLIISNSDLLASRIRNFKRMQERRLTMNIGVVYQTPAEKLEKIPQILREIIEQTPQTRFDRAHLVRFGDYSIQFEIIFWVLSPEYRAAMDIQQSINLAVYRRFKEEDIQFAYPTQTLFVFRES
ncbi:MAG: mechanosensitive ion channel family protein [candidate division KSB1 bacterium]|nr:mechanosensitive ion channel family protein [candidate division KSB1 bacterium]MDZ7346033.1 mechanosensitive ion channel family protein [candidate division KSB1 bacterium]